ncbi:shikimate kinase [Archaeoglobus neptunius]|uniref:shikimate kinase n=1 Tax=Archaeoglobus neptunius TaxID=2798580 RepID=UPI0019274BE1|nr:shikimate kinase [Archaeoglobus neptunius]
MIGTAYAAGTVLNALATGKGSAFGIEIKTTVKLKPEEDKEISITLNGRKIKSFVAERILRAENIGGEVVVKSEIPGGSGLGSSSAFVNALLIALYKFRDFEINAHEILKTNARVSLETGISYTGAFDDAAASLLGGFVVSDNIGMKLYRWDRPKFHAAVLIPEFTRGKVNWREIRKNSAEVQPAFEYALDGNYCRAMRKNTEYYCRMIGYPLEIAEAGWKVNVCCGLSGNGPAYVAFGSKSEMKSIAEVWRPYGKVIVRKVPDSPSEDVQVPESLFKDP